MQSVTVKVTGPQAKMGKVKIKHLGGATQVSRTLMKTLLAETRVRYTKLVDIKGGHLVFTEREEDTDTLIKVESQDKMKKNGYEVEVPREKSAKLTLVCKKLDQDVGTTHIGRNKIRNRKSKRV